MTQKQDIGKYYLLPTFWSIAPYIDRAKKEKLWDISGRAIHHCFFFHALWKQTHYGVCRQFTLFFCDIFILSFVQNSSALISRLTVGHVLFFTLI